MRSINKVIVIGNLTRDPEMRATPNGQTVTTFGIATNREWITKDGSKKNSAEFHECVAWARLAEICHNYLRKGRLVYIEGYLKTRNWDKDGQRKFKTEVVVQDMIMLEKKANEEDYVPETIGEDLYAEEDNSSAETLENAEEVLSEKVENKEEKSPSVFSFENSNETPDEAPKETPDEAPKEDTNENPIDKDLGL